MIDFPASPTNGQIFSATNGVVYKWSAAYTSWLAQNAAPPLGGTGDFSARNSAVITGAASLTTLILDTVSTGNAGLWYSVSTGRYTPPAGRYAILIAATGQLAASAVNVQITLRKNSTLVASSTDTTGGANFAACPSISVTVDANGTDWFDIQGATVGNAGQFVNVTFTAFPLTGLQGPTGGAPGPVVGDFYSIYSGADFGISTGSGTLVGPNTIITGNSGAYYNTANGRFTPPAGRYKIWAGLSFYYASVAQNVYFFLRKNGVQFGTQVTGGNPGGNLLNAVELGAEVDANGTDYFEAWAIGNVAGCTGRQAWFGAFPTQGMVGPQGPAGPAGVTQTVFFETGAVATGTTIIPTDDTIPQITEGDQYMSLAITPQSATSKLIIEVTTFFYISANSGVSVALFQDSTANALAVGTISANTQATSVSFRHVMTSGTTSATTFRVRAGPSTAMTLTFNGFAGARLFGGVSASSIVIREVP